jgi:hypothetical protein
MLANRSCRIVKTSGYAVYILYYVRRWETRISLEILRLPASGMLRRVALVRTDVSEELSASIIRVTRIGELGTTLAITSNRYTLYLRVKIINTYYKLYRKYIFN